MDANLKEPFCKISFKEKIVYYSLFLTESESDRRTPAKMAVITE